MNASTSKLVDALLDAGDARLRPLIVRARHEEFHDFSSPHAMPEHVLVAELRSLGFEPLAQRVIRGDFDATREESKAWADSPDGQETIRELGPAVAEALGFPWSPKGPAKRPRPPR